MARRVARRWRIVEMDLWDRGAIDLGPEDDGVQLVSPQGATIAFQLAPKHRPPTWPSDDHPQQLHIDFDVADLEAGDQAVPAIGATKADTQPGGQNFRVYLDPAGHPFCLVLDH